MRRVPVRVAVAGPALLLPLMILLGSAGLAYWAAGGTGAGVATTGTAQPVTLSPAVPTTRLYPSGQASVEVIVTNPNPGPVRLASLSLDTSQGTNGFAVDADHSGCGVSTLSFTTQSNGGAGWTIAGNASTTISLSNALAMGVDAANACQGAAIEVHLKIGAS